VANRPIKIGKKSGMKIEKSGGWKAPGNANE
jgi:hypothetical protein